MNIQNFIDNEFIDGLGTIDVFNPVTGKKVSQVASASAEDVNRALRAAQSAADTYGQLSINARKALIDELIAKLKGDETNIVDLLIQETGKTYDVASYDFNMLVDCLGYYVEEVKRHYAETIPDYDGGHLNFLSYQPVGVVAGLLTWNFPLLNLGYKLGPALASGCTSVFKISDKTPMASMRVAELINEVSFP